ncbi:MAG: 5-formyltetrahydrofolate cyclo-ligase [Oscillospiraceae bacterium]|nr:5-formyltetrahydrofolate cyclo-ligase [Oscillospiraceae bacterium]
MSSVQAEKKALRSKMMQIRRAMSAEQKAAADAAITALVMQQPEFSAAKKVFAYVSMPHEVGTQALLQGILDAGKTLGLPVCSPQTHTLTFYRLDSLRELHGGMYRIPVPPVSEDRLLTPDAETLVLVPMLAIDREGWRLGAGGGYYDRFLAAYGDTVQVLGICYAENCVTAVPHGQYDKPILCCITEQKREEHNG